MAECHHAFAAAGPLEATINNLTRELQQKDVEGKELQRHWINLQTELVAKQNDNNALTESHAQLTSNYSILYQKKAGLERELEREQAQVPHTLSGNLCCMSVWGTASSLCIRSKALAC